MSYGIYNNLNSTTGINFMTTGSYHFALLSKVWGDKPHYTKLQFRGYIRFAIKKERNLILKSWVPIWFNTLNFHFYNYLILNRNYKCL